MNGVGFFLLVLLSNTSPGGASVPPSRHDPIVVAAAASDDARRDRIPETGAPGRTGSEGTAQGKASRDPTKTPGRQPSRDHRPVGPESSGNPASQGPGDAIGKTVPERPTHQDRKIP